MTRALQGVRFFFSSRRRHTRLQGDWSSDVCSSDLPRKGVRVTSHGFGQDFDRDVAIELPIACAVDLTHATLAEQCRHLVRAELLSNSDRHEIGAIIARVTGRAKLVPSGVL